MSDPVGAQQDVAPDPAGADLGELIAGAALGLFVGMMLGMSATPLVGTVMAAFVAVLATFFGLADTSATSPVRPAHRRIAVFCLAAVVATLAGLWARTHDLFSPTAAATPQPTMQALARELADLKFSDDEVRQLVKLRYFGVAPEGASVATPVAAQPPQEAGAPPGARSSILFGTVATQSDCDQLARAGGAAPGEQLTLLKSVGGFPAVMAKRVELLPDEERAKALAHGRLIVCGF